MKTWHSSVRPSRLIALSRRSYFRSSLFEPEDFVLLKAGQTKETPPVFLGPLVPGRIDTTHKGRINHDEIIGKSARDVVRLPRSKSNGFTTYRLHEVRLEDYVLLSKRIVTPIYPHDANLIVSLFDFHPEPYDESIPESGKIEIFEAGTGHGSLTLHLSRAIHAGNSVAPKCESYEGDEQYTAALSAWKSSRRAVIHSIDNSASHSGHAKKTVRGFRRGQYLNNVDFHTGDASEWLTEALQLRSEAFLTHAFLDLPSSHEHLALVASALRTDGSLILFCPSITQINECALMVRKESVPLELDRVVELGVNGGTGGRLWDVRLVRPRAAVAKAARDASTESDDSVEGDIREATETSEDLKADNDDWNLICRPKVGDRIQGGGFLALFKKKTIEDDRTIEAVL